MSSTGINRLALGLGVASTLSALVVGVVCGTYAAGGSDSSCYLNAAKLLALGRVGLEQPLVGAASWPDAGLSFSPSGFLPSPVDVRLLVPICSPGLPLTMAALRIAHVSEFLVVPLLGALAVWLTFVIGRRVDRPMTGAAAAMLVACSPTFLYQVVQPMSDVPATAWWLLALTCVMAPDEGRMWPLLAGLAASMALLTRPNLLPLALVMAIYLVAVGRVNDRGQSAAWFMLGLVPGGVALAFLQRAMYGSPFSTGYGSVSALVAGAHVLPNARRYAEWLIGSHTPLLLVSLAAPALASRSRLVWLCLALAATTIACYLPYLVFDDWWYTRFLLPAIPLLIVLSLVVLIRIVERLGSRVRGPLAIACLIVVMGLWISTARDRHAFELATLERHYVQAGTAVSEHLPPDAAVLTVRNSGSVLYAAGRPAVSWDVLEPSSLDSAIELLRAHHLTPYLLLELDEEPTFRDRFRGASAIGGLDWPPKLQVGRTIRIYDPTDRERFLADGKTRTEFVVDGPRRSRH